jgi:hypothetical protein
MACCRYWCPLEDRPLDLESRESIPKIACEYVFRSCVHICLRLFNNSLPLFYFRLVVSLPIDPC